MFQLLNLKRTNSIGIYIFTGSFLSLRADMRDAFRPPVDGNVNAAIRNTFETLLLCIISRLTPPRKPYVSAYAIEVLGLVSLYVGGRYAPGAHLFRPQYVRVLLGEYRQTYLRLASNRPATQRGASTISAGYASGGNPPRAISRSRFGQSQACVENAFTAPRKRKQRVTYSIDLALTARWRERQALECRYEFRQGQPSWACPMRMGWK